jgi:prevent-host-death family protein
MDEVSIRELRARAGVLVSRASAGERFSITRNGRPVARLVPARRPVLRLADLLERRRSLPAMDLDAFRRDLDGVLHSEL